MLNRVLFLIYSHHDEHSFPHLSRLYRVPPLQQTVPFLEVVFPEQRIQGRALSILGL